MPEEGPSAKFDWQRVGLDHTLMDGIYSQRHSENCGGRSIRAQWVHIQSAEGLIGREISCTCPFRFSSRIRDFISPDRADVALGIGKSGLETEGVDIIPVQPMELILLKLKISVNLVPASSYLPCWGPIIEWGRWCLELEIEDSEKGPVEACHCHFFIDLFGVVGRAYAHNILIPFLLEYLVDDSSSKGLEATWQIGSWFGFILGLLTALAVGFQVLRIRDD